MSRAFTREEDNDMPLAGIGERPVSAHRNLVTPEGLAAIEAEIAALREHFVTAERWVSVSRWSDSLDSSAGA